jgi:hypothetical protein
MALWRSEMNLINLCLFIKNTFRESREKMCGGEGREEEAENGKRTVQRSCLRLAKHINTETNIFEGDISSFKGKTPWNVVSDGEFSGAESVSQTPCSARELV